MNSNHCDDPLLRSLGALPRIEADPQQAERLRERCRSRLAQPQTPISASLEPATVGAVCAMYVWEIARTVIR